MEKKAKFNPKKKIKSKNWKGNFLTNYNFKLLKLKNLRKTLRLGIIFAMITLLVACWSTERQEGWNEQIFWDVNRLTNKFGFFMIIIGWGFWEFYLVSKKEKAWLQIGAIIVIIIATILVNGVMGTIAGSVAVVCVTTSFILNHKKILPLRDEKNN